MNEDEPSMTPEEIRDAHFNDIIYALSLGGFTITREEIIAAVTNNASMQALRLKIEQTHDVSDEAQRFGPGKALTNLKSMYDLEIISFKE
ncbi:MAG: hypothetical protein Q8L37_00060 [Candidatus Gottesmanbacteria bacterium]|nr:hypothetical protein [Candidatus Gottesmanbacteria bacterium]